MVSGVRDGGGPDARHLRWGSSRVGEGRLRETSARGSRIQVSRGVRQVSENLVWVLQHSYQAIKVILSMAVWWAVPGESPKLYYLSQVSKD